MAGIAIGACVLGAAGCADGLAPVAPDRSGVAVRSEIAAPHAGRFLVLFAAHQVPPGFAHRVAALGGSVEIMLDEIGVAAVTRLTPEAAAALAADDGIRAVEADAVRRAADMADVDAPGAMESGDVSMAAVAAASPTLARFYARQWNMRAIRADVAWAAGHLGARDVVVAIVDTGIDYTQPDLAGLVDLVRSRSFVPDEVAPVRYAGLLPFGDLHYHGTAVASVVATNGTVLAGVTRDVTLLAVKVTDSTFAASDARVLAGIVYAADQGADVISVGRVHSRDKSQSPGVVAAYERASNHAFRKGALVVAAAGNDAWDFDQDGDRVRLPCQVANVICVSATGPAGVDGVNGPWQDVDTPAAYTAFGLSAITVAAPGGAGSILISDPILSGTQFRRMWTLCTTTSTRTTPAPACLRRDPIAQPSGTSFAAPHVAGLAALLVAQVGHGRPALVRARILQSADDLGKPGRDPYYGAGRINVARALGHIE